MRRTKEEVAQTRQALLDAALTVFSEQGYHPARLQDIADAAGVTRGAVYHHFGSKANLYITLIEEASMQSNAVVEEAIAEGGTFQEVGTRVMVDSWTFLEENRRFREVAELFYFKTGDAPELAEIARQREEEANAQVDFVAGFIQQSIEEGVIRADLDPVVVARAFIAYLQGVVTLWLANRNVFSIKDNALALAEIFMQGTLNI